MPRIEPKRPAPLPVVPDGGGGLVPAPLVSAGGDGALSMGRERDLARLLDLGTPARADTSSAGRAAAVAVRVAAGGRAGTSHLRAALEDAASRRRGSGPEGREKLLSSDARARLTALLDGGPPGVLGTLEALVAELRAPGASAVFAKAAAARALALASGDGDRVEAALATLRAFAARLRTTEAGVILERATVLDLDSTRDASSFEPLLYDRTRGTVHPPDAASRADNDGLLQRFTGSCGPSTVQLILCEEDPVRAFVIHDAGVGSIGTGDVAAAFQAELLAEHGSHALGRRAHFHLARLRNGLARLVRTGGAAAGDAADLRAWVEGRDLPGAHASAGARRALHALREYTGAFPGDDDLGEMRADPRKGETGLSAEDFAAILDANLSPITGYRYRPTKELEPGDAAAYLDEVARALRKGLDVPIGVVEAVHWLALTGVEGRGDGRRFLVSDPYSGRTVWVPQAELVSGSFVADRLGLLEAGERDWIDCFLLPEPV